MKKVTGVLIGAGQRGAQTYSGFALRNPERFQVVAVAEPDDKRREKFSRDHNIPLNMQFSSWEELFKQSRIADLAMVCTQDRMHFLPVKAAMEKGYHVICEKPMSPDFYECIEMGKMVEKYRKKLIVCYVLRYSPFMVMIKRLLDSGTIGSIVTIQHQESVGYWHQAHSFVRGNWRNSKETSPMIMSKSCHDMDIMLWLVGKDCKAVSSFGSLLHFKKENAPEGSAERCYKCGIKKDCPYNAEKIYIEDEKWYSDIIRKVVSLDTSKEALESALKTGDYGRCVYACDNDVVDHQVANLLFDGGITVSFTMSAFTLGENRTLNIMGTRGQIKGNMENNKIEMSDFLTGKKKYYEVKTDLSGHFGGDDAFMDYSLKVLNNNKLEGLTSAKNSVMSHIVALACERSRIKGKTIAIDDFMKEMKNKNRV